MTSFENIKDINKFKKVYKYDSRTGIMYFNHQSASQCDINRMVTESCNMSREIINH